MTFKKFNEFIGESNSIPMMFVITDWEDVNLEKLNNRKDFEISYGPKNYMRLNPIDIVNDYVQKNGKYNLLYDYDTLVESVSKRSKPIDIRILVFSEVPEGEYYDSIMLIIGGEYEEDCKNGLYNFLDDLKDKQVKKLNKKFKTNIVDYYEFDTYNSDEFDEFFNVNSDMARNLLNQEVIDTVEDFYDIDFTIPTEISRNDNKPLSDRDLRNILAYVKNEFDVPMTMNLDSFPEKYKVIFDVSFN
jgi:hypothetical protein